MLAASHLLLVWRRLSLAPLITVLWALPGLAGVNGSAAASSSALLPLTLAEAISYAWQHDPWLQGSTWRQSALQADSIAVGQLPDPQLSFGVANLPIDSVRFNQEPMTQLTVGLSQVFPRGNSRQLRQQKIAQTSAEYPFMRADRRASVAVSVAHHWLDYYRYRQTIKLIEQDRALFEQLVDVAQSHYSSALGKTRQQDLVRAQLELIRLEDRLAQLQQQQDTTRARLSEWLSGSDGAVEVVLAERLPHLQPVAGTHGNPLSPAQLARLIQRHPRVLALEQKISASHTAIEIARQQYQPQWGVNARYGYRDDDPQGNARADFFSLGVSVEMPLFTARRQDKSLQAARFNAEAVKTDKALLLRELQAGYQQAWAQLQRLDQRRRLYDGQLLDQVQAQAQVSLTAYTNDSGDFAEVVRARIAQLNAGIDALNIRIDRLKAIAQLNYFLAAASVDRSHRHRATPEREYRHD